MEVALEAGTHSPWVSRLLEDLGHRVWVANPRKLRLIYENRRKCDEVDAEYLARLARLDPQLLHPLRHRSRAAQADLSVLRARENLVRSRTQLINHVRGSVKALGHRLPRCSTRSFERRVAEAIPPSLVPALSPVLEALSGLNDRIGELDRWVERCCRDRYPQTERLRQVNGVGALTALAYCLVLADPDRFRRSRDVGAYLGLVPARRSSGGRDQSLRITKEGDEFLRRLLVQSAHYILGPFGQESELRRFGQRLMERGGQQAKRRAVVAVARKLAVLLHKLWISEKEYEPLGFAASA
jgi:transposase